jgi:hypothetical protein
MDIKEIEWEGVDWIGLAQDKDKWWAVTTQQLTFAFHKMQGISRLPEGLFASQEGLCCLELVV